MCHALHAVAKAQHAHTVHLPHVRTQRLRRGMQVMVGALPAGIFKGVVPVVRTLNNLVGGVSFVTCARMVGSQKAQDSEPAPVVQAERTVEKKVKRAVHA